MSNKVDAMVEGGETLDRLLAELPSIMRQKILPKALKAAAQVVQQNAIARINPDRDDRKAPGLAKTIIIKVKVYDQTITAVVGPAYLGVNHAHLIEFGHRLIKLIRDNDGSIWEVQIGFVPAKPFLRPAADETLREQRDAIIGIVSAELATYQGATT